MQQLFTLFFLFLLVVCGWSGCDSVALRDRWTQPEAIVPKKNVLVLEFTGQKCVNCPAAAQQIVTLQEGALGEKVIAVAVHGGQLSENGAQHLWGLANADSEWLTRQHQVEGWPNGSVDGAALLLPPAWAARVAEQLSQVAAADLRCTTTYDAATRRLSVAVQASSQLSDSYLHVYLVEDSIRSLQYLPNGSRTTNYVHRHVLRQILTPRTGHPLPSGSSSTTWQQHVAVPEAYGLAATQSHALQQHPELRVHPEQLHLVAFVLHRPSERVLQVVQQACVAH